MTPDFVLDTARLIEQREKLLIFLRDAPDDADIMTITFRKGKRSRTISIRSGCEIADIREVIEGMLDDTNNKLLEAGVTI